MEEIYKLAAHVQTPIALAALALAVLFGLYRAFLKLGIFPKLPAKHATRLLGLFLTLTFLLVLVTVLLWFFQMRWTNDPRDARVRINFKNAPLHDIFMSCAQQAGAALALDKSLGGTLSIGTDGKLSEVLDQICEVEQCVWDLHAGRPPILFVNSRTNGPH